MQLSAPLASVSVAGTAIAPDAGALDALNDRLTPPPLSLHTLGLPSASTSTLGPLTTDSTPTPVADAAHWQAQAPLPAHSSQLLTPARSSNENVLPATQPPAGGPHSYLTAVPDTTAVVRWLVGGLIVCEGGSQERRGQRATHSRGVCVCVCGRTHTRYGVACMRNPQQTHPRRAHPGTSASWCT
jgi:hypothetical protein